MSKRLTEEERLHRAEQKAVIHLEVDPNGTHTWCGRAKGGGLSWVGDEGEFEDRESYRCKTCERIWLRDREEIMNDFRALDAGFGS